jgi:hypothetical protein
VVTLQVHGVKARNRASSCWSCSIMQVASDHLLHRSSDSSGEDSVVSQKHLWRLLEPRARRIHVSLQVLSQAVGKQAFLTTYEYGLLAVVVATFVAIAVRVARRSRRYRTSRAFFGSVECADVLHCTAAQMPLVTAAQMPLVHRFSDCHFKPHSDVKAL